MPNSLDWDWVKEVVLVEALDSLSIKQFVGDDARIICMGWRLLFRIQEPVFKELCVEFLTTTRFKKRDDIHDTGNLTFCLGGERRECSLAELAW